LHHTLSVQIHSCTQTYVSATVLEQDHFCRDFQRSKRVHKMHAPVPKEAAFAALMNHLLFQRLAGMDLACLNGFTFNEILTLMVPRWYVVLSWLPALYAEASPESRTELTQQSRFLHHRAKVFRCFAKRKSNKNANLGSQCLQN